MVRFLGVESLNLDLDYEKKTGTIDVYKNPITDEMLYEYFELTEEEIGIITNFLCSMNIN